MELKYYLSIARRRWLPLLMTPMIVGAFVIIQVVGSDPSYTATAQLTVTRAPQQIDIDEFRYNEYYLFLASEFMVDDLVEVVRGNVFAEDVHRRVLEQHGVDIPLGEIQQAIESDRRHRILEIDVTYSDEDHTVLIAQAATQQLNEDVTVYFGFEHQERGALVEPIHVPDRALSDMTRNQVFWALQLMVAFFGGVLIAIFLEHIDDRLYTAEMVERALDLDVIAETPRGKATGDAA